MKNAIDTIDTLAELVRRHAPAEEAPALLAYLNARKIKATPRAKTSTSTFALVRPYLTRSKDPACLRTLCAENGRVTLFALAERLVVSWPADDLPAGLWDTEHAVRVLRATDGLPATADVLCPSSIPIEDMPQLPESAPMPYTYTIAADDLRALACAMGDEDARCYLNGVFLDGPSALAVATNGHILVRQPLSCRADAPAVVIPAELVKLVLRVRNLSGDVVFSSDGARRVSVELPDGVAASADCVDGTYPPYKSVVPSAEDCPDTIDAAVPDAIARLLGPKTRVFFCADGLRLADYDRADVTILEHGDTSTAPLVCVAGEYLKQVIRADGRVRASYHGETQPVMFDVLPDRLPVIVTPLRIR